MENKKYPIKLIDGEIYNILIYVSKEYGRKYIISIIHTNGEGYALHLWHRDYEKWLSKVIDARPNISVELYDITISNWDKIMKHINECIEWLNNFKELPKYPKESSVIIVNHDKLSGISDRVKDHLIMPFEGYYYVLLHSHNCYYKEQNISSA
jgi:hypothetical protein